MRAKLRSTRWQLKDLMFLKIVATKLGITVDKIVREGALDKARELLKQMESKDAKQ